MKKRFLMYLDYEVICEQLENAEIGELMHAIFDYEKTGNHEQLSGKVAMAFAIIKNNLDRDRADYKEKCERNKELAMRRWDKKYIQENTECERMPTHTNNADLSDDDEEDNNFNISKGGSKHAKEVEIKRKVDILFDTLRKEKQFWDAITNGESDLENVTQTGRMLCEILTDGELRRLTPDGYLELASKWYHSKTADNPRRYLRKCYENLKADKEKNKNGEMKYHVVDVAAGVS